MEVAAQILSFQAEYHQDASGIYQLVSTEDKTRSQLWFNGNKEADDTETGGEMPDKSAGEYDTLGFKWKEDGTLMMREMIQENMDDVSPGAPPLVTDESYELEILEGSKEDFDAGKTISVRLTEASAEQYEKDLVKEVEGYFSEIAPGIIESYAGSAIDMTTHEIEAKILEVELSNSPAELSKSKYVIDAKDYMTLRFRWTLYKTK